MEVTAPLPAREGKSLPTMARGRVEEVINVSQRDYYDFIPSSFLFWFPLLQFAKAVLGTSHQPPSSPPQTLGHHGGGAALRACPANSRKVPLSAVHDLVPVSPPIPPG